MAKKINYAQAAELLEQEFRWAEEAFAVGHPPPVSVRVQEITKALFETATQSYREALLGCALVRLLVPDADIRSPYANQGESAFSGRSLDEKVINPFLVSKRIPCSRGPYLAVFRRNIRFVPETRQGLKDKSAYDAFLNYITELERANTDQARTLLRHLLYRFVELREREAKIPVNRLPRISLEQYRLITEHLLSQRSGGAIPVLLVSALLESISRIYELGWNIRSQGINVADSAAGVSGDITVLDRDGLVRMVLEVTERRIDRERIESTFHNKLADEHDYLFAFAREEPSQEAKQFAQLLFAQGHEMGFIRIGDWVYYNLATVGRKGREIFQQVLIEQLEQASATVKMMWNDAIDNLLKPA